MIFNFDQEANQAEIGYVFDKGYWGKGYRSTNIEVSFLESKKINAISRELNNQVVNY